MLSALDTCPLPYFTLHVPYMCLHCTEKHILSNFINIQHPLPQHMHLQVHEVSIINIALSTSVLITDHYHYLTQSMLFPDKLLVLPWSAKSPPLYPADMISLQETKGSVCYY